MDFAYPVENCIYAVILAFFIGVVICPVLIPILHKLKYGQTERDDGPQSHLKKSGTPTMGGIAILIAFAVTALVFSFMGKGNIRMFWNSIAVILITLGFGIVGFIDDYIKVAKKRSLGLRAYQKILIQLIFTAAFAWYISKAYPEDFTKIYVPFAGGYMLNLGIIYIPFLFVVMLGTVNGVNLTDGLDGLAGGVTMIVAVFFTIICLVCGETLSPAVSASAVGALLAFLVFNAYPAKVFMGDTGSLALGGYVAGTALILKMPLFIIIVGIIYLCESLSVIIQVGYFKKTGKRVFKMAPIHHHFELCGWSETKIVTVFYIITALMCMVGYLGCRGMF